jgi:hypothetical protein
MNFNLLKKKKLVVKFSHKEVIIDFDIIMKGISDLECAVTLGNLEHLKIIFFEDESSKIVTETTVCKITVDEEILKKML